MKVLLGCGINKEIGFVNCDIDPRVNPDLCFDMEKSPWPFEDNSVNIVESNQVLEHISNIIGVMNEIWRICRNGAICHHKMPHGLSVFYSGDPTHKSVLIERTFQYFNKSNRIKWGLWENYGGISCDYEIIHYGVTTNTMPPNEIPNQSMSITLKVIKEKEDE